MKEGQEVIQNMSHVKPAATESTSATSEDRRKEPAIPEAPEVEELPDQERAVVEEKEEEKEEEGKKKKKGKGKENADEDTVRTEFVYCQLWY